MTTTELDNQQQKDHKIPIYIGLNKYRKPGFEDLWQIHQLLEAE